jgi:hypothetical protein
MKTTLMPPTIGRIVLCAITQAFADLINSKPSQAEHPACAGDVCPVIVTCVHPTEEGMPMINGRLIVDGESDLCVRGLPHGEDQGCWHWPVIHGAAELGTAEQQPPSAQSSAVIHGRDAGGELCVFEPKTQSWVPVIEIVRQRDEALDRLAAIINILA